MRRYGLDYSDIHNWDIIGYPGEYVYGEEVYIHEDCMDERWLPVKDFEDLYWVSNKGRLWSIVSKQFIYGTPNIRSGYMMVTLYRNGRRIKKNMHRLVAEAFISNPHNYPLVRHLNDYPEDNYEDNLAWGTYKDNVRDCISNGNFRYFKPEDIEAANQKRRMTIKAVKISTGEVLEFRSQVDAARYLGISSSSISDVICGKKTNASGWYFYPSDKELTIDLNSYRYSRHYAPIRAIDIETGETFMFRGQTEAALELGMSISSISMVLSGKMRFAKGYIFEYVEEGYYD